MTPIQRQQPLYESLLVGNHKNTSLKSHANNQSILNNVERANGHNVPGGMAINPIVRHMDGALDGIKHFLENEKYEYYRYASIPW
jgi:hypothetical protein